MGIASISRKLAMKVNNRANGETVIVRDVADPVCATRLTAVRGRTEWTAEKPRSGVQLGEVSVDFIIEAKLVDGEPARGWTIETEQGELFRVLPFGPQNQLWRWHDRTGQTHYRIHTKERNNAT